MAVKKPIICLEFDGVICGSYTSGDQGPRNIPDGPVPGAIEFMADALAHGFDVVIHSSRARHWGSAAAIRRWLKLHAGDVYDDAPTRLGLNHVRISGTRPADVHVILDHRAMDFKGAWPRPNYLMNFEPWYNTIWLIRGADDERWAKRERRRKQRA